MKTHGKIFSFHFSLFLLLAGLLFHSEVQAQSISGRVVGSDSIPVKGATVVLQRSDSTYLDATATDAQGRFFLSHTDSCSLLIVQAMSYHTFYGKAVAGDMGTIVLQSSAKALDEVEIKATRPFASAENGRLVFDLKPLLENKIVENAYQLLKAVPLIRLKGNSVDRTAAAGATTIILNGKPARMSQQQIKDYLKALPPERVEKVEIVYSAPPEWHTTGSAINIVLKKRNSDMLQGLLSGEMYNQYSNTYGARGSLFVQKKQWSVDMVYTYGNSRGKSRSVLDAQHTLEDNNVYGINIDTRGNSESQYHILYTGLGYEFKNKSNISLSYNGSFTPIAHDRSQVRSEQISPANSASSSDNALHNVHLVYELPMGLRIGSSYTRYNTNSLEQMTYYEDMNPQGQTFAYNQEQHIDQYNAYASMSHRIRKRWSLTYGADYTHTRNTNGQYYTDYVGDGSYRSSATNKEDNATVYASTGGSFLDNKLSIYASLSAQFYRLESYRHTTFLPTANLTYVPLPDHQFVLSYYSVRRYPSYWQKQNYVRHMNQYMTAYGNPGLRPDLTSVLNFTYLFKRKYALQMFYYRINDFSYMQFYQRPDRLEFSTQTINGDYTSHIEVDLTVPFNVGKIWYSSVVLKAYNERYKSQDWEGPDFDRSKWGSIILSDNTFTLCSKPHITLGIDAFYHTPTIMGLMDMNGVWGINAGLKCSFANNRATLSFQCNDLFETEGRDLSTRYANQHYTYQNERFYERSFSLTFTYRFNNYKDKRRNSVDTSRFGTN